MSGPADRTEKLALGIVGVSLGQTSRQIPSRTNLASKYPRNPRNPYIAAWTRRNFADTKKSTSRAVILIIDHAASPARRLCSRIRRGNTLHLFEPWQMEKFKCII